MSEVGVTNGPGAEVPRRLTFDPKRHFPTADRRPAGSATSATIAAPSWLDPWYNQITLKVSLELSRRPKCRASVARTASSNKGG